MIEIRGFKGRIQVNEDMFQLFNPYTALWAVDRQAVIDLHDKCTEWQRKWRKDVCGFTITMPCGNEWRFRAISDILFGDMPCSCGRPDHYLIKYKEAL